MNAKISKFMAVAITAMFCITAVAVFAVGEDSSAADTTHKVYIEVVSADLTVSEDAWVQFTSDGTVDGFVKSANDAFALYGYPEVVFTTSEKMISVSYATSGNNACYSYVDNKWTAVGDTVATYPAAAYIAFCFNNGYISAEKYDALDETAKASWSYIGWGGDWDYMKSPEAETSECPAAPAKFTTNCYVEIIDAKGAITETKWVKYDAVKTLKSVVVNANKAFVNAGLSKVALKVTSYGIGATYDGSGNSSPYYVKDGKWVAVSEMEKDYFNETIGLALNNGYISKEVYNALSDDAKKAWADSGMAETYPPYAYQKTITEPTDGYKPASSDNNTGLIIGVVVAVIVVIAIGAFVFYKKK